MKTISKELVQFLVDLKENNNREWFNARKDIYKGHQNEMKLFCGEIEAELNKTDQIEKFKIYRIYRDVRFSKDKIPFKTNFGVSFLRATNELRGSYFLHIQKGFNFVGGGFYGPEASDLKRIRQEFEMDDSEIREILADKKLIKTFGKIQGNELKTAPRGFDPEHPAIDLIKMKQYYFLREFTDKEVLQNNFQQKVVGSFLTLRPYFDYMSSVLTTNLNGESIV